MAETPFCSPSEASQTAVLAEINITPFCDVLLVLLIIFMILAALAAPPGFQKELASKAPPTVTPTMLLQQIRVEVSPSNHIFIDGKPVPMRSLYGALAAAIAFHEAHAKQRLSKHISLLADSVANYDVIIKILDAARQAGDDDVGLVTQ